MKSRLPETNEVAESSPSLFFPSSSEKPYCYQLTNQIASANQGVSSSIQQVRTSLAQATNAIQNMTYSLVGMNYWNNHTPDPMSKLGQLQQSVSYLNSNSCLQ